MAVDPPGQQGLAIQAQQSLADFDLPKTDIMGLDFEELARGIQQFDGQTVEMGDLGAPLPGVGKGPVDMHPVGIAPPFIDDAGAQGSSAAEQGLFCREQCAADL